MSFERDTLARILMRVPRVARVVVAETRGSTPREVGAAMLVWPGGQEGTIGGGTLEHEATQAARAMLGSGATDPQVSRHALGPDLGQCCGGAVTLVCEVFDRDRVQAIGNEPVLARPVGPDTDTPAPVGHLIARARQGGPLPAPGLVSGWMVEPLAHPRAPVWIWGAGHVGRALVAMLAPLPQFTLTWADTAPARFPDTAPDGVTLLPAPDLPRAMHLAARDAHHVIVSYSHKIDLALCHAALAHGFASAGLIGSATKWARFRKRLGALGHDDAQILRITCPIGDPALGKHPQAIALGVAALLLRTAQQDKKTKQQGYAA